MSGVSANFATTNSNTIRTYEHEISTPLGDRVIFTYRDTQGVQVSTIDILGRSKILNTSELPKEINGIKNIDQFTKFFEASFHAKITSTKDGKLCLQLEKRNLIEECLRDIAQGREVILKNPPKENVVMIIGPTGSGKSCLCNHLCDVTIKGVKIKDQKGLRFEAEKPIMQISHSTTHSCTRLPGVCSVTNENFSYIDCPGFGDTHGAYQDIANAFFRADVVKGERELKFLLTIGVEQISERSSANGFYEMFNDLIQFLGCEKKSVEELQKIADSIVLIITKVPSPAENEKKALESRIRREKKALEALGNKPENSDEIQSILKSIEEAEEQLKKLNSENATERVRINLLEFTEPQKSALSQTGRTILKYLIEKSRWTIFSAPQKEGVGDLANIEKETILKLLNTKVTPYISKKQLAIQIKVPEKHSGFIQAAIQALLGSLKENACNQVLSDVDSYLNKSLEGKTNKEVLQNLKIELQDLFNTNEKVSLKEFFSKSYLLKMAISEKTSKEIAKFDETLRFLIELLPQQYRDDHPINRNWSEEFSLKTKLVERSQKLLQKCVKEVLSELKSSFSPQILDDLTIHLQTLFQTDASETTIQNVQTELKGLVEYNDPCTFIDYMNRSKLVVVALKEKTKVQITLYNELLNFFANLQPKADVNKKWRDELGLHAKLTEWNGIFLRILSKPTVSSDASGRITVRGYFPKTSQIIKLLANQTGFKQVEIYALNQLTIDEDLSGDRWRGMNLFIIAPVWEIRNDRRIDVTGANNTHSFSEATAGATEGQSGNAGAPGKPGSNGGHFFGIGFSFKNSESLTITSNGGKGSSGQKGGYGRDGVRGANGAVCHNGPQPVYTMGSGGTFHTQNIPIITSWNWPGWSVVDPIGGTRDQLVYNPGHQGGNGGNGGEGGVGGLGGLAGTYELISLSSEQTKFNVSKDNGESGADGPGGNAGIGGLGGQRWRGVWHWPQHKWNGHYPMDNSAFVDPRAASGANGTTPATKNKTGLEGPSGLTGVDIFQQILNYQRYLFNENNPFLSHHMEKFRHQMELNYIKTTPSLEGFIKECDLIEDLFKHAGSRIIPYSRSIVERMSEYAKTKANSPEFVHLQSLCFFILSKICQHEINLDSRLVIDIRGFLSRVEKNIADLETLEKNQMIKVYEKEFTAQIEGKIAEADIYIKKLLDDIKEAHNDLDKQIKVLIEEVQALEKKGEASKDELIKQREKLKDNMRKKAILGALSIAAQVIGCCFPPCGPLVGAAVSAGLNVLKDATTGGDIFENLGSNAEIVVKAVGSDPFAPSKDASSSTLMRLKDIATKAKPYVAAAGKLVQGHLSDEEKLKEMDKAIEEIDKQRESLEKYRGEIATNFSTSAHDFVEGAIKVQKQLKDKSTISLDFSRLEMKRTFENIKRTMKKVTEEFEAAEGFIQIVRQMEEAIDTSVTIYSRIQDYQDRIQLVGYMANLAAPQIGSQNADIEKLKLKAKRNIVLEQYFKAVKAVRQWAFPFGTIFLGDQVKLEEFEERVTKKEVNEVDFMKQVSAQLKSLSSKVEEYAHEIQQRIDKALWEGRFYPERGITSFYKWNNPKQIESLFKGQSTHFHADLSKAPSDKTSIKFNHVEIQFKSNDDALQKELDKALNVFRVEMRHSGHSYYVHNRKLYHFSNEGEFSIGYSYGKDKKGSPNQANEVYKKMKSGNFLLSPYTEWIITLVPSEKNSTLFERFKEHIPKIEIHLVGKGQYVDESHISTPLDMTVYEQNSIHNQSTVTFKPFSSAPILGSPAPSNPVPLIDIGSFVPQIRDWLPGTPLIAPPVNGIKVGLRNLGNTCWLNTVIKFIACTPFYDDMLINEPPATRKKLQGLLREIIISLRENKDIPDLYFSAFLNELRKAFPTFEIGRQHDAPDFLRRLTQELLWNPLHASATEVEGIHKTKLFPRYVLTFQPLAALPPGYGKNPMIHNFVTQIEIYPEATSSSLNLSELFTKESIRKVRPEKILATAPNASAENVDFRASHHFINLPKVMMIYIRRFKSDDSLGQFSDKINTPIRLDNNQLIGFTNNELIKQNNNVSLLPGKQSFYRIGAAMVHEGNLGGGHYFCMERTTNGGYFEHSDLRVSECSESNFGTLGYFIRLDLVEEK